MGIESDIVSRYVKIYCIRGRTQRALIKEVIRLIAVNLIAAVHSSYYL